MVGGQIHPNDHATLRALGVSGIFGAGTTKADVLDYIKGIAANRARDYPIQQT
jgi:methylmalonyl-CoA mutase cobalamin-binding subunit